jgi:RNA polymerase sigma-70 factor (ECF subfamily)
MIRSVTQVRSSGEEARPMTREALRHSLALMGPELFGRALRMSRSPSLAEDLVQDTIERAIRFETHYTPGTNLRAWVHQILFSVFVTRCRRARRERNALDHLTTDPCAWTSPDAAAEMSDLSPPLRRALDALPKSFRDAVVLVDLQEMSYKDAASRLAVPVGTVMSRLFRGRRQLAQAVRSDGYRPDCEMETAAAA